MDYSHKLLDEYERRAPCIGWVDSRDTSSSRGRSVTLIAGAGKQPASANYIVMRLSYEEFKRLAAELAGVDLSAYKSQQMDRRLHALMHSWGLKDYDEFLAVLRANAPRLLEFQKRLTINVSEFFRNPDRFVELREIVLPELFGTGRRLRIWSAGCANGAEAYSVAIVIREARYEPGARILGTDIDRESLRHAHEGYYNAAEVRNLSGELLARYFQADTRGYHLAPEIRGMVEFKRQNLLHDSFERDYDLILCRNVVIYLTEQAKSQLYLKFLQSLRRGGYLLVGGTEPLLNFKEFGLENPLTAFYRKAAGQARVEAGRDRL